MQDQKDRRESLFRELAAEFIAAEANMPPMITVTAVRLGADFGHATIFVTVYPEESEGDALNFLKRKGSEFRGFVKNRGNIKVIPFFDFKVDLGDKHRRDLDSLTLD